MSGELQAARDAYRLRKSSALKEIWKPVVDYGDFYEVSNQGRVRSWRTNAGNIREDPYTLQPHKRKHGYLAAVLRDPATGKLYNRMIHQLVLEAFVGPRPKGTQSGHLDGNPGNNRVENLKWVTPKENAAHKVIHGTASIGSQNGRATIDEQTAIRIRNDVREGYKTSVIMRRYRVSKNVIYNIVRGKTWRHVFQVEDRP